MFEDKVSLLCYALQRSFQASPNRLMTNNAYLALLGTSLNASTTDEGLNFYDSQHRFEHSQLLLVLLSSLPYVPKPFSVAYYSHAVSIYTLVPGDRLDQGEKLIIGCQKATIYAETQESDILFTWIDLQAKLNTELLNNLGNFINRVLSFIAKDPCQVAALVLCHSRELAYHVRFSFVTLQQFENVNFHPCLTLCILGEICRRELAYQVRLVKNRDNNEIKGFVLICSIQASMESIHDSLAEALVNLTEECEKLWSKVYVVWPKSRTRSIKMKAL
ncbi:unnamed protein product [Lactuca saligna]|uniref:Methionyl/Leucyl tRNA synthetase domain-containing protein n=1 Tax=Lactuca saligna TaxID=75948 RepID=A0AA35VKG5_LACSI|nr:unnamed protein product [Lactuca saligna]